MVCCPPLLMSFAGNTDSTAFNSFVASPGNRSVRCQLVAARYDASRSHASDIERQRAIAKNVAVCRCELGWDRAGAEDRLTAYTKAILRPSSKTSHICSWLRQGSALGLVPSSFTSRRSSVSGRVNSACCSPPWRAEQTRILPARSGSRFLP